MDERTKSLEDQVAEIQKLVTDAQARLDQVTVALRSLQGRLGQERPVRQARG